MIIIGKMNNRQTHFIKWVGSRFIHIHEIETGEVELLPYKQMDVRVLNKILDVDYGFDFEVNSTKTPVTFRGFKKVDDKKAYFICEDEVEFDGLVINARVYSCDGRSYFYHNGELIKEQEDAIND